MVPCLTPEHPVYSTLLQRYLQAADYLNLQGFWRSALREETYQALLDDPSLCQDICGNSFTAPVFQAVFLTSLAAGDSAWNTVAATSQSGKDHSNEVVLRRITRKRKAPEYGEPIVVNWSMGKSGRKPTAKTGNVKRARGPRQRYQRKKGRVDSRKFSKGKKKTATLWDKEALTRA